MVLGIYAFVGAYFMSSLVLKSIKISGVWLGLAWLPRREYVLFYSFFGGSINIKVKNIVNRVLSRYKFTINKGLNCCLSF